MTHDYAFLKAAALGLLGAIAREHVLGHQESKAARFVLTSGDGTEVEIMFEKNEGSPPNLWCLQKAAGPALPRIVAHRSSLAKDLWTKRGAGGAKLYGRHSALKDMQQLGDADLFCFAPKTVSEIGQIIDRFRQVRRSDLT